MSKVFTYTKQKKEHLLEYPYGYVFNEQKFEYTVDDEDVLDALIDIVYEDFFEELCEKVKDGIRQFITTKGLLDALTNVYESELKTYFADDAFEYYEGMNSNDSTV